MRQPILEIAPVTTLAPIESDGVLRPRPAVADALRHCTVSSTVQELGKRGVADVKVLPRAAVSQLVHEAASRIADERWELERPRIEGEALALRNRIEQLDAELADEREGVERWRQDVLSRLESAEIRASAAEARLAEARSGFEAQLAAVLANPRAFAPVDPDLARKKKARKKAKRLVKAAVKRLARENREMKARLLESGKTAPEADRKPAAPAQRIDQIVDKVARRSFGFGDPRAVESRIVAPPPPPQPAPPLPSLPATSNAMPAPAQAVVVDPELRGRLSAIEAKLDALLAAPRGIADAGLIADDGVASRFRDGRKPGLRSDDPQADSKRSILARLRDENVKLRSDLKSL